MVPKARMLADLLAEYEGPLTADFQRVYGLRLSHTVVTHEMGELEDLILWLPNGSAFLAAKEAKGDKRKARELFGWTVLEDLALGLANISAHQTYVVAQVNSPKRLTAPKPVNGPRGKTPEGPKNSSATGIARALLQAQKKGG